MGPWSSPTSRVASSSGSRSRQTVELALAVVRDHGELAFQRRDDLRRRKLNQVDPLRITVCRSCRGDRKYLRLRRAELDQRFPGLIESVLRAAGSSSALRAAARPR
jgi:hypothetical protein